MDTFTIIDDGRPRQIEATVRADRTLLAPQSLATELGWELKSEGLCKGDACYPVPSPNKLLVDDLIDLERFAEVLGRPIALSHEHGVAALGTAAATRADSMESLKAPDFSLPDLDGRMHSLSEHLGKKVFLVAHASW
jgi:hypothetical protein